VAAAPKQVVTVGGRELSLSNLDKVLYPATGTTKGQVIEYYARIAPVMLPHLAGRALTFNRFPIGVDEKGFFEKRCAKHRPDWVPTAAGPGDRDGVIQYCVIDEPAAPAMRRPRMTSRPLLIALSMRVVRLPHARTDG
jgi:bifunctional non-homologous end joining protein LigD